MRLVWGTVVAVEGKDCKVIVDGHSDESKAIAYPRFVGAVESNTRVLLNTTAVDLGLGTGGTHFVVAKASEDSTTASGVMFEDDSGGHIMKLRYTPLQRDVLAVESQESPSHSIMERATSLEGVPVVCCGLHSQVPLVAAAIKQQAPHLTVGYVMTDQAALLLELSQIIEQSKNAGLINLTVTVGQAMGGDIESINLHSGLLAACHVGGCDVIIVGIGPGVAGTSTPFGHGGIAQGEAINAVSVLGGQAIAVLRMSFADARTRHQGISHHTVTALKTIALGSALLPIPAIENTEQGKVVDAQLSQLNGNVQHSGFEMETCVYAQDALRGIKVTTMGRSYEQDPIFFEAAFAAGIVAAGVGQHVQDEAFTSVKQVSNKSGCAPTSCSTCQIECPSNEDSNIN